jgi:hypothetical protein
VALSCDIDNDKSKSDVVAHWLHTDASLTIMDPNQPEPLMKLPISIERDSMQYHTSVLVDSATTLNYASQDLLTRNNILGKCTRGPKIVARIANEQRISTTKTLSPINILLGQKKITYLSFIVLPHLKRVDFIFGLPAMKEMNMSIQPSKDMVLIGGISFICVSQPRRVSCFLVDSSKMHKILAKAARNKHTKSELFLLSLHFAKELESIKIDFAPELDTRLKDLGTKLC